jgi:hypothetical protein
MPVPVSRRLRLALTAALLVSLAGFGGNAGASVDPNVISRSGSTLMLHGHSYRFTGVNAYELGTLWSVNVGCGSQLTDAQLDAFFAGLRADSVVRFWAFQAQGVNKATHQLDYTGLDRVFRAAERHGQRLMPVLGNQSGVCDDGHWKDAAWYAGAYAQRYNDNGRGANAVSYESWVTTTVNRYKSSPALGMWEPVNEPEATNCQRGYHGSACYSHHVPCAAGATQALRTFFDRVGARIKKIDPDHLIASGVIGGSQCGLGGAGYSVVHGSPYVDVATFHDYNQDTIAVPAAMSARMAEATALDKPLISEEVGIKATTDGAAGCVAPAARATLLAHKLTRQLQAGSRGFLAWFYAPTMAGGCRHDIADGDASLTVLRSAPV